MKSRWFGAITVGALLLTALSFGEDATVDTTVDVPGQEAFLASVEIAGAVTPAPAAGLDASAGFENEVALGYQFDADYSVFYVQPFELNLANQTSDLGNGSLRARISNIYNDGSLAYSLEPRVYLPTSTASVGGVSLVDNMISEVRLKNILDYQLSANTLFVSDWSPVVYIYGSSPVATPSIGSILRAGFEFTVADALVLKVPLEWAATKIGDWENQLTFWPELEYTVDANLSVGAAFRSGNLIDGVGDGVEQGTILGFLRASL